MVGARPGFVSIDGGTIFSNMYHPKFLSHDTAGVLQTIVEDFGFNGESDLDLQYAMTLTNPQNVTLLQTGDLVEGQNITLETNHLN